MLIKRDRCATRRSALRTRRRRRTRRRARRGAVLRGRAARRRRVAVQPRLDVHQRPRRRAQRRDGGVLLPRRRRAGLRAGAAHAEHASAARRPTCPTACARRPSRPKRRRPRDAAAAARPAARAAAAAVASRGPQVHRRPGQAASHPSTRSQPQLVLSVIEAESNFDTVALSPKNAKGLMQLIPETAARFGVRNSYDPAQNIRGGMAYLRWLLAYFEGDVTLVAAAYNAGEGAVEPLPRRAAVRRDAGLRAQGADLSAPDFTRVRRQRHRAVAAVARDPGRRAEPLSHRGGALTPRCNLRISRRLRPDSSACRRRSSRCCPPTGRPVSAALRPMPTPRAA